MQIKVVDRETSSIIRQYTDWPVPALYSYVYFEHSAGAKRYIVDAIGHVMDSDNPFILVAVTAMEP